MKSSISLHVRRSLLTLSFLLLGASSALAQEGVYKKLPGKCRIGSSFGAGGPGFLPQATDRSLSVLNSVTFTPQGGNGNTTGGNSSSGCGLPLRAIAVVISTSVVPRGQAGTLKIFEAGNAAADGNSVAFNGADAVTNDMIVPLRSPDRDMEITINSSRPVDYVLDVVGYFRQPVLACSDTAEGSVSVPPGVQATALAPTCSEGTFETATLCTGNWNMPIVFFGGGNCSAKNNGSTIVPLKASRRCCKLG